MIPRHLRQRVDAILQATAAHYEVRPEDLAGRRRARPLPEARMHAAVALLRAGLTLKQAGAALRRDHSTVIYYRDRHAREHSAEPQHQVERHDPNVAQWLRECGL